MTTYDLRHSFNLIGANRIAISRADFESSFTKTGESIEFTFGGWDDKSYGGETRKTRILRTNLPGCEGMKFIKVGKSIHMVFEDGLRIERATGISHPTVGWLVDVVRA